MIGGAAAAFGTVYVLYGSPDPEAVARIESRLAAAEETVTQVPALGDRISAVEEASPPAGDALVQRMNDLESQLAGLSEGTSAGGGEDLGERLAALEQRLDGLSGDLQVAKDVQDANATALSSVESTLSPLQQTLEASSGAIDSLGDTVQSLAGRVGEAENRLESLGGEYQRGAAMIVAIADVDRAIARAEPFDSAFQSLSSLLRDDAVLNDTLSVLEPIAAEGAPSLGDLQASFGETASQVLLAAEGDRSIADQVGDNVFGILNMRPSGGSVEGDGTRAILSRAQTEVRDGDLAGAVDELGVLEGAAAEAAGPWIERARSRLAAEDAVADLRAHAQSLVAKGT